MDIPPGSLTESVAAVVRLMPSLGAAQSMSDETLLVASSAIAAAGRELDARGGWVAAEIARRSRRELGHDGLAQRQGFRTPEALIQKVAGASRAEAVTLVRVETVVAETAASDAFVESADSSTGDVSSDGHTADFPGAVGRHRAQPVARGCGTGSSRRRPVLRAGRVHPCRTRGSRQA